MSPPAGQYGALFRLNAIGPFAVKCIQIPMSVGKTPRNEDPVNRVLRLARTRPVVRARDVADQGIHTSTLTRMTRAGALEKVGPGRYRLAQSQPLTGHPRLVPPPP